MPAQLIVRGTSRGSAGMVRTAESYLRCRRRTIQGLGDQETRSISSRVINKFHKNRRYHRDTWRCWTSYCIHPVNHGPCISFIV